jgi:stage V sporulation protein AD
VGKKIGSQTLQFDLPPYIKDGYTIVGPKESQGPLKEYFHKVIKDNYYGEKTWEKAEKKIMEEAADSLINANFLNKNNVDFFLAGDLLNQTISSNYAARTLGIPFLGLYGACSTMVEGIIMAAVMIEGGFASNIVAATSSHYGSAERQFRMPVEHGNQRTMTAQWTVTGSGATLISKEKTKIKVTSATIGKVLDMGVKDAGNMGAAMAPAAADTIVKHFKDTGRKPDYYDVILTGDLGEVGKQLTQELVQKQGYDIKNQYDDCGVKIYENKKQDTHAGGSGCACSAVVFNGYILKKIKDNQLNKVFLVATGALMSPCIIQQGESIPGIAHGIAVETC